MERRQITISFGNLLALRRIRESYYEETSKTQTYDSVILLLLNHYNKELGRKIALGSRHKRSGRSGGVSSSDTKCSK